MSPRHGEYATASRPARLSGGGKAMVQSPSGSLGDTKFPCIHQAGAGNVLNHDPALYISLPSPHLRDKGLMSSLLPSKHKHTASREDFQEAFQ